MRKLNEFYQLPISASRLSLKTWLILVKNYE